MRLNATSWRLRAIPKALPKLAHYGRDLSARIQGLLPGTRLVALSGMQVRHPEEVARCGAR